MLWPTNSLISAYRFKGLEFYNSWRTGYATENDHKTFLHIAGSISCIIFVVDVWLYDAFAIGL